MSTRRQTQPSSSSEESDEGGRNGRRDENSISFRHFLQPRADVMPVAGQCRRSRGRGDNDRSSVPMDLVDIPGHGLPDFVQDYLVLEAQLGGEVSNESNRNAESSLDLANVQELMPNLLSPSQRHDTSGENHELENQGAYGPILSNSQPLLPIPDFLSDGPIHYDAAASSCGNSNNCSIKSSRFIASTGSLGRSQIRNPPHSNPDALLEQIQRLEREVHQRDITIQELENVILDQKAELLRLYENSTNELASMASTSRGSGEHPPLGVPATQSGLSVQTVSVSGSLVNGDGESSHSAPTNAPPHLQESVCRAEALIHQLLEEIRRLKQ